VPKPDPVISVMDGADADRDRQWLLSLERRAAPNRRHVVGVIDVDAGELFSLTMSR